MENNNRLKHIAIIEATSRAKLIKIINDSIDKYNLNLIHYNLSQGRNERDMFQELWIAELFFEGDNVFSNTSTSIALNSDSSKEDRDR